MDLRRIDLNLLTVFEAVMRERSVTKAALALGLSQPAISSALNRLRGILDDPLLVRTNGEMLPTPRAQRLIMPVEEALATIRRGFSEQARFDPAATRRTFKMILSDIGEMVYVPPLLHHLAAIGSELTFQVYPSRPDRDAELLATGMADLAIGTFVHLKHGLEQERLSKGTFACMVRLDHPVIGDRLSTSQFIDADHLVVAPPGGTDGIVTATLSSLGIIRKVVWTVPHFLAVAAIIAQSDLVVTIPEKLGRTLTRTGETRLLPLPFPMRPFETRQYWHRRYDSDPGNLWLRETVRDLFVRDIFANKGAKPAGEVVTGSQDTKSS